MMAMMMIGDAWPAERPRSVLDHYVNPADRTRIIEQLREQGQVQDHLLRMKRADGTAFWSSVTARVTTFRGREVLISANRDLTERVSDGRIREDFYYRIRVFEIRMPALRDRVEDVVLNRRAEGTERLLEIAERYRGEGVAGDRRQRVAAE